MNICKENACIITLQAYSHDKLIMFCGVSGCGHCRKLNISLVYLNVIKYRLEGAKTLDAFSSERPSRLCPIILLFKVKLF